MYCCERLRRETGLDWTGQGDERVVLPECGRSERRVLPIRTVSVRVDVR